MPQGLNGPNTHVAYGSHQPMICNIPQGKTGPHGRGSPAGVAPQLAVWCRRAVPVLCLVALTLAAAGCAGAPARQGGRRHTSSLGSVATTPPAPSPSPTPCPVRLIHGFSCLMTERIHHAERYAADQAGTIGIVLHNRQDGATWRNKFAHTEFPAASTIKLAMVTDIMLRADAGQITLGPGDWSLIYNALHESSDTAATALWNQF
jgi:hypothetical protein